VLRGRAPRGSAAADSPAASLWGQKRKVGGNRGSGGLLIKKKRGDKTPCTPGKMRKTGESPTAKSKRGGGSCSGKERAGGGGLYRSWTNAAVGNVDARGTLGGEGSIKQNLSKKGDRYVYCPAFASPKPGEKHSQGRG